MAIFRELKRRNVIRVAIAYVIVGWLLLQVSDTLVPALHLPEWFLSGITLLLILGFPISLIFAWAFELTPEGVKREKNVVRSEATTKFTSRKLDFVIIGLMAVAILYLFLNNYVLEETPSKTAETVTDDSIAVPVEADKSIAVIPFVNRSIEASDAYFVDGIHDDILTHLAKLSGIHKVISRTSVERYRGTTETIPEIARALGVAHILEGGVQRAGNRVRINVQLIDAATDEHLWAETYDRELTAANIFAVQSEIATFIAEALRATLSPEEQIRLNAVPTENMAALEAYFLGKQRLAKRTSVALAEANDYFQQAIEADPDFALAHVGLADTYVLQVNYSGLPRHETYAKAEASIEKAMKLDDQLGEAYATSGLLKSEEGEFEGAEIAFKSGLELNPNYAMTYHWYSRMLSGMGRHEDALALHQKAAELDPLSATLKVSIGADLQYLGRFDEALARYRSTVETNPGYAPAYNYIANFHWLVSGQLNEAVKWKRKSLSLDPGHTFYHVDLGFLFLDLGDLSEAEYWMRHAIAQNPEGFWPNLGMQWFHAYRGDDAAALDYGRRAIAINPRVSFVLSVLRDHELRAGRHTEARALYAEVHPELLDESEPKIDGANYRSAIDLALVLSKTGEQDRVDMLLNRSLQHIQTVPRLGDDGYRIADVQIYALLGEKQKALSALRQAIDAGWRGIWWYYLKHDPILESIHDEPEFQAMVQEIETDMAAQLARLGEREFEALDSVL